MSPRNLSTLDQGMVVQDSDGTFFRESNSIKFHFNLHGFVDDDEI